MRRWGIDRRPRWLLLFGLVVYLSGPFLGRGAIFAQLAGLGVLSTCLFWRYVRWRGGG